MQSMIIFALFIASAVAAPNGYAHAPQYAHAVPVVQQKVVGEISHTPIYNVQKVHHTVHPISIPVHHPAVHSTHQEHFSVLAKAPKLSGYAYTSEVRHDQAVKAIAHAPVAVAHAAPAYAHAAPVAVAHAAPAYGHSEVVAHSPQVSVGHAPAPYVSGTSVAVAPAVIKETPAVSSYQLNTGRIETVSQAHYGTVHQPVVSKVGYQAHAVPIASHGAYPSHGAY